MQLEGSEGGRDIASKVGLGAVLHQLDADGATRPVAFASRRLTDKEERHAGHEKEALAFVWAVQHFKLYLRTNVPFQIETDHCPLQCLATQAELEALNQELEGKRAKEVSSGPGGARRPGGGQGGLVTSVTGRLESINI